MNIRPKKGYEKAVAFIDAVNPYIVIVSIAGLVLEYTMLKEYVASLNSMIDIVFVLDFTVRMLSFRAGRYFFRAYGWVDFLACLPGLASFMQYGRYFGLFKVVRIGRFFKIIRVLRFLRIFSFLKKMKGDSPFIQERIMKTGVSVVLVFVAGIALVDLALTNALTENSADYYRNVFELSRGRLDLAAAKEKSIVYYTDNLKVFDREGKLQPDFTGYRGKLTDTVHWYTEINLTGQILEREGYAVPVKGFLVDSSVIMRQHDSIMLILVLSLVLLLVILIFYIGYIFARDMRIVQLVNDSLDAGDYWLLREEARQFAEAAGPEGSQESSDEITELLLKVSEASGQLEGAGSGAGFASMQTDPGMASALSMDPFSASFSFGDSTGQPGQNEQDQESFAANRPSLSRGSSPWEEPGSTGTSEYNEAAEQNEEFAASLKRIEEKLDALSSVRDAEIKITADAAALKAVRVTAKSIGGYILKILKR